MASPKTQLVFPKLNWFYPVYKKSVEQIVHDPLDPDLGFELDPDFHHPVLSPLSGTVEVIRTNPNVPRIDKPASEGLTGWDIQIKSEVGGVRFYNNITKLGTCIVQQGDKVEQGATLGHAASLASDSDLDWNVEIPQLGPGGINPMDVIARTGVVSFADSRVHPAEVPGGASTAFVPGGSSSKGMGMLVVGGLALWLLSKKR